MQDLKTTPRQLTFQLDTKSNNGNTDPRISYNKIPVMKSTFKAGLDQPVHRWFRLTPSFGPDLVREMLIAMNFKKGDAVLDPFAGASTTLIECALNGIDCFGFEINPFLHFVGSTCLNWSVDPGQLENLLFKVKNHFQTSLKFFSITDLGSGKLPIPKIHNPFRWWRKDILYELVVLRETIKSIDCDKDEKNLLLLGLAAALVPDLTNVTLGRLQLHFIDRDNDDIEVWSTFERQIKEIIEDITAISHGPFGTASLYHADATNPSIKVPNKANLVITSPPYPNRYSYVWNTRPHLYFLEIFDTPKQAGTLDMKTIGGTWGSATSSLAKGKVEADFPIIDKVVMPVARKIREQENGNLMANYMTKYFNLIGHQITAMEPFVSNDVRIAYVVGCSRLKKVYVETDIMLANLIEGLGLGYKVSSIERIRKRNSGKNLYETIVYAAK